MDFETFFFGSEVCRQSLAGSCGVPIGTLLILGIIAFVLILFFVLKKN